VEGVVIGGVTVSQCDIRLLDTRLLNRFLEKFQGVWFGGIDGSGGFDSHYLAVLGWHDLPERESLRFGDCLAVVFENHVRVSVSHLQSQGVGVFKGREVVARKGMTEAIVGPSFNP
jgi:hypothetical protein